LPLGVVVPTFGPPSRMSDRTVTETRFDFPSAQARPRVAGFVVVFAKEVCALVPHRIEVPRTVGRDQSAHLSVDDPGISRVHATLEPMADGLLVTDLSSRNGTFVNGVRVTTPKTPAHFGSVVRLAKTLLFVCDDIVPFEAEPEPCHPSLVGGPSLASVRLHIAIVAGSRDPVLLEGETGTGKEVVAQILHENSGRVGRFVAVNCAALAPELVESELFGHAKGAFSGSIAPRPGLFRTADAGTLLLDEIGELPLPIQAKLLRAIETGEVRSVGEDLPRTTDVRIIAATNRNLSDMVQKEEFRGDLLHRIAATRIRLPPLAQRREDIPQLCAHFLDGTGVSITAGALETLFAQTFEGNLRELRNVVRAAASRARRAGREAIHAEDVIAEQTAPAAASSDDELRSRVVEALDASNGNVMRAARQIGMARSGLYETMKRLRLNPASYRRR
jgi:transcriptional regulator of acetoin/glycerol metabolism